MKLAVYIATTQDANGNPRRGWIIYTSTGVGVDFVDEGYDAAGLRKKYGGIGITDRIQVAVKEYNYWKRHFKNG